MNKRTTRPAGSIKALAEALGITRRRVDQLLAAGMPLDPEQAKEWKLRRESGDASAEQLRRERILLVREQREAKAIENATRRGELISRAQVQESAHRVYSAVRAELLKLPHDLPPRLEGLSAAEMSKVLRSEIIATLTRLSDESGAIYDEPSS